MPTKNDKNEPSRWNPSSWPLGPFALAASGLVAIIGIVTCWLLWLSFRSGLAGTEKSPALFDLARSTVTLLGVLTVGGAAAVAFRRQQALENQDRREDMQSAQLRRAELHSRYEQAAAQLGHDEPIIRIAGAYALEALATEWAALGPEGEERRDMCIDLLCGYLRSTTGILFKEVGLETYTKISDPEERVRDVVAHVIMYHLSDHNGQPGDWSDHHYVFTDAYFNSAPFDNAWFSSGASFLGAHFSGYTSFENARFYIGVTFASTYFRYGVDFSDAHFEREAWFDGSEFRGEALFDRACFKIPADFIEARFEEAVSFKDLQGTNPKLTGAEIRSKYLTSDLRSLGAVDLERYRAKTRRITDWWRSHLSKASRWRFRAPKNGHHS